MQTRCAKRAVPVEAAALLADQYTAKLQHCNTLQHTATHCNTLQHTATQAAACRGSGAFSRTIPCNTATLQHTATYCNTPQHILPKGLLPVEAAALLAEQCTATLHPCNTLQRTATQCNTLQHALQNEPLAVVVAATKES